MIPRPDKGLRRDDGATIFLSELGAAGVAASTFARGDEVQARAVGQPSAMHPRKMLELLRSAYMR